MVIENSLAIFLQETQTVSNSTIGLYGVYAQSAG